MRNIGVTTLMIICAVAVATWMSGTPTADARSSYWSANCSSCHATSTCNGCHSHGTHSGSAKSDVNITGVTNKTSYSGGETVTVTMNGGYKTGPFRAILYNQSMQEVSRVSGATYPVTLTAPAPTTAGTYNFSVAWYGNQYDAAGAYFQPACSSTLTTNCWKASSNANHGEAIVETNSFTVTAATVENTYALCHDGIDNDGDGKIDCADPDCAAYCVAENCQDGIDNDLNGLIDCADPACATDASCTGAKNSSHANINAYNGPTTCIACHTTAGNDVLNSMHGSWTGPTPNVTNIAGDAGKWRQTNNYCTDPELADYGCVKCHVTTAAKVLNKDGMVDLSKKNLSANEMDCLQCHSTKYRATFNPTSTLGPFVSCADGSSRTYLIPQPEADGKIHKVMRLDLSPGETALSLARTVTRPTNGSCLKCHSGAGGSDGAKRGDISSAMVDPAVTVDIHLSSAGNAKLTCTSCHVATNHQIPGRGNDMRGEDTGAVMKKCVDCHAAMGTGTGHGTSTANRAAADRHIAHVDCTACHIDSYGKGISTEMSRDWTRPTWNPAGCEGQGAWVGTETRGTNVIPEYRFWNKTSWVYDRNGKAGLTTDTIDGGLAMSYPLGTINDKLYPFKVHTSNSPTDDSSGKTNFDVLKMFMTGCYDQAAISGLSFIGETGAYTWTQNKAFQLITHGVVAKTEGDNCSKCHVTNFDTSVVSKLDKLGYKTPKPTSDLCNDCHGLQTTTSFISVHDTHRSRGVGCASCHSFSRP